MKKVVGFLKKEKYIEEAKKKIKKIGGIEKKKENGICIFEFEEGEITFVEVKATGGTLISADRDMFDVEVFKKVFADIKEGKKC